MTYSYEDLCAWRKEAQMELKKHKAGMNKTKSFIWKVDKTQKGLSIFSGAIQRIVERIRK